MYITNLYGMSFKRRIFVAVDFESSIIYHLKACVLPKNCADIYSPLITNPSRSYVIVSNACLYTKTKYFFNILRMFNCNLTCCLQSLQLYLLWTLKSLKTDNYLLAVLNSIVPFPDGRGCCSKLSDFDTATALVSFQPMQFSAQFSVTGITHVIILIWVETSTIEKFLFLILKIKLHSWILKIEYF